jgi:hypothetical protein
MELIKNSENFNFNDTTENGWKVTGSVNNEINGNINIHINVSNEMEHVGNFYYNKPAEGNIHMNHDVSEANRDTFVTYTDSVIDFVLEQF